MNRRSFLKWLGIGVPAAVVVAVAAPKVVEARLGEWNNYYSEGDPELMEAIENWRSYSEIYPNLKTTFTLKHRTSLAYDRDVVSTLKHENTLFEALAKRKKIPMNTGVKREFFRYES